HQSFQSSDAALDRIIASADQGFAKRNSVFLKGFPVTGKPLLGGGNLFRPPDDPDGSVSVGEKQIHRVFRRLLIIHQNAVASGSLYLTVNEHYRPSCLKKFPEVSSLCVHRHIDDPVHTFPAEK